MIWDGLLLTLENAYDDALSAVRKAPVCVLDARII